MYNLFGLSGRLVVWSFGLFGLFGRLVISSFGLFGRLGSQGDVVPLLHKMVI